MLAALARARPLARAAALAFVLSACATTHGADGEPLSPAQRQLREQNERFAETVATGAIAGALLLGLVGALAAGPRNRGEGALVGAAAGAALGAAAGHYIAKRNQRFATREQAAAARIAAANEEAAEQEAAAQAAQAVAAENRAKIARLEARIRAGEANAAQLARSRRAAEEDLAAIDTAIENNRRVEAAMRSDGAIPQADRVAESRRRMEESARELREALARVPAA